ncbi:PadR family transcriptional regulator [Halorussus sp. AFM4]|uniref:PadR family transcriptional regulator n=1 Tax=Halorussus sp. AFM4 TaxID=3421651 RepID=UPI003EBC9F97
MSTETPTTEERTGTKKNDFEFTDDEVSDVDLTEFQVHCLFAIRGFETGRYTRTRGTKGAYGLDIKRTLERDEWYGEEINHGRLYPNLDGLVDKGLLEKAELDKRTNTYDLTEAGSKLIARTLQRYIGCFKGDAPDEGR